MPESFDKLITFDPHSAILGMGCSSFNEDGSAQLSYHLSKFNQEKESTHLALFCKVLQNKETTLEYSSTSVLLTESEIRMKDFMEHLNTIGNMNHCHLSGQPTFFYSNISGSLLCKADYQKEDNDNISILHQFASKEMKPGEYRRLNSNLFYDGKTVKYLEAPVHEQEMDQKYYYKKWDSSRDSYRSSAGNLVSLNADGNIESQKPFAVPSHSRKSILTNTHCLFPSIPSCQFFLFASLNEPQKLYKLTFPLDDIVLPDSGINYVFKPLLILPTGKHLLCARNVGIGFEEDAKRLGLSLSEIGMVELPEKVG